MTTEATLTLDKIHAVRLEVEKEIANFTYPQLNRALAEAKAHNRSNDLLGYLVRKRLGYITCAWCHDKPATTTELCSSCASID